ncbi:MAG: hypothetical protein WKG01_21100 [Kofleriaceae bacterium]
MRPLLLVFSLAIAGCLPVPAYQVQRAARVPHATVPLRTGQPLPGPVEVTVGMSSAGDAIAARRGNEDASIEVPERQARGEFRVRAGNWTEIAAVTERSFESSSRKLDPTQASVGPGSPSAFGFAVRHALPVTMDRRWWIGLEVELMAWTLPYVEYRTCIENCEGVVESSIDRDDTSVLTFGLGITPSYRQGPLSIFGGVFARNHPTISRKGIEYEEGSEDVERGPINALVHLGAAYRFTDVLSGLAVVSQNVTTDPVRYGPTLGVAISATLGR